MSGAIRGARLGDALILTKGLGVGIYSAAIKKQALPSSGYAEMIASTTLLNRIGPELAQDASVHAITDVTGFGLLGHGLEMARGSGCVLVFRDRDVPTFSQAASLAQRGFITGASRRNWASYGDAVLLPPDMPEWRRHLLSRPADLGRVAGRLRARQSCGVGRNDRRSWLSIGPRDRPCRTRRPRHNGRALSYNTGVRARPAFNRASAIRGSRCRNSRGGNAGPCPQ